MLRKWYKPMRSLSVQNKKSTFICFTGIDGSGKTTLAKSLAEQLTRDGIEYQYVYNRLTPYLLKPIIVMAHKLFLRGGNIRGNYAEYSAAKKKAIKNNPLSLVYRWLLFLDYSIQVFIKVSIPLTRGKNIVCDRYIYDTLVTDLAVDFNYSEERIKQTLNRFFRLFPRPNLVFLVDLPEEIAYLRKNDTPSVEYLRERRGVYQQLVKSHRMIVIDGSESLAEVQAKVQVKVNEVI